MELVKQFNSELSSLYESKPPISKAKMTSITRTAIKAIKLYKHVVQSVEKFIQKCKPEYKVPGLYVIDSIVRQSRHQFGTEKDVFAPRFARNLQQTFIHLFACPPEDKSKVIRVLNLWQKNNVFESEVIQPLFDLADPNHPVHKEQAALAPSNGITQVKPAPTTNITPKNISAKKEGGTAGWINQLHTDSNTTSLHSSQVKPHVPNQVVDVNLLQQLQQLQTLLLDQQSEKVMAQNKDADQIKFDKKLLDFDYGEEEDEDGTPAQHHQQQQQQQVVAGLDSIGSILSNPEILRQLQTLQQTLSNPQHVRQQQLDMEEKLRKIQEMRQQEEEFDKHLAQTVPNLPFADECELKPGGEVSGFPGMDLTQPPPGYLPQQKLMVPPGMMMKPPPSPLEDGEHASSDADERMGRPGEEGGPSVVVLDSDSPSDSPAHSRRRKRRSRSRSRSHRRSRSDSRSRSRSKRKRSSSFDDKDWDKVKQRETEKEKERERKRKGLPTLKKNHLAVCSTTLWIGHLSKLVQQEELSDTFGEFGDIVSIDLIPPRGCAFICMNRRQDAYRALQDLKHHKLQGKTITLAWAPGKGMKGKEYKDYWEVEQGVSYIPWNKLTQDIDLELLEEGGMIDEESFPEWLKERQKKTKEDDLHRSQSSSQAEDDETSKGTELDIPVPAPTLPGYIPLPEGPQPSDIKVNQPPPNMPPMMAAGPGGMPPLGMMPPFGLPNVPRLLGPMGMAMGPGLMPNVPLGVPPPGMQGLMGNPLMHQQMMSRMPQPVGSPFNPPPGVGILGGHPQLSQIPLPGSQEKGKASLTPLGVAPPSDSSGLTAFGETMMQIPFTLPPQLQMPGLGMLTRPPLTEKQRDDSINNSEKRESSSPRNDALMAARSHFGHPPPQFSPMSLMKIPPPMSVPPPNKSENLVNSEDKDEREAKDKDYRDSMKDYKDRDKDRERDRDYRNKRDRDYRGDRDYRDRFDKDYRERDKEYKDKDRERKDRRERSREIEKDDKSEQEFREKENKIEEKERKDDFSKDDKNYRDRGDRDRSRIRDRERDRDRDRGRDRMGKWGDRDRERVRERDRDDKRGRDRERDRSKEMKGSMDREKAGISLQDRLRNMAHDHDRSGDFSRGAMDSDDFQGPGGSKFCSRNEGFHQDGFPTDMHGRHPGNRRDVFDNRGPSRDMFDLRCPPPDGFDSRGPPPEGFGPRGGPPMDNFGPRGPPPDGFGPRGPPSQRASNPPDGFDPRGPPPGGFGLSDGFDPRGPPPDFDGQGPPPDNFSLRGPPPDNFNRGLLPDNFGPGAPPPDNFVHRGPPGDEFGPHGHPPFEGFGGPHGPPGEFQPRIRIEFFARGRGRGGLQDNFRGRGTRGGIMFTPRGGSPRGPRAGMWMEAQGPPPPTAGFGFPPRGFTPESGPERFVPPIFEDNGRGRGVQNMRGRGRGFQGRVDERRREGDEPGAPSPKRSSRWSNPSPPPSFALPEKEERLMPNLATHKTSATEEQPENESHTYAEQDLTGDKNDFNKNIENTHVSEQDTSHLNQSADESNVKSFSASMNDESNKSFIESKVDSSPSEFVEPTEQQAISEPEERMSPFANFINESSNNQLATNESSGFPQDSQTPEDVQMSDTCLISTEVNKNEAQKTEAENFLSLSQIPETLERTSPTPYEPEISRSASLTLENEDSYLEDHPHVDEVEESRHPTMEPKIFNEPNPSVDSQNSDLPTHAKEQYIYESELQQSSQICDEERTVQSLHFEQCDSQNESQSSVHSFLQQTFASEDLDQTVNSSEEQNILVENEPQENLESITNQRLPTINNPDSPSYSIEPQAMDFDDMGLEPPQPNETLMPFDNNSLSEETNKVYDSPFLPEDNNDNDQSQ